MKPHLKPMKTQENTPQNQSKEKLKNPYLTGFALIQQVCGPRYSVLEYGPAYAVDSTMVPEAWVGCGEWGARFIDCRWLVYWLDIVCIFIIHIYIYILKVAR